MLTLSNAVWGVHAVFSVGHGLGAYLNLGNQYRDENVKASTVSDTNNKSLRDQATKIMTALEFSKSLELAYQDSIGENSSFSIVGQGNWSMGGWRGLIVNPNIFGKRSKPEIEFALAWSIEHIKNNTQFLYDMAQWVMLIVSRTLIINCIFPLPILNRIPLPIALITGVALHYLTFHLKWVFERRIDQTVMKICSKEALQAKIDALKKQLAENIKYRNEGGLFTWEHLTRQHLYSSEGNMRFGFNQGQYLTTRISRFEEEIASRSKVV